MTERPTSAGPMSSVRAFLPQVDAAAATTVASTRPSTGVATVARVKPRVLRQVLVGGGPRTEAQLLSLYQVLRHHLPDIRRIEARGGHYSMAVVVLTSGDALTFAHGAAWGPEHGLSLVNSPPEHSGLPLGAEGGLLDYRHRIAGHVETFAGSLKADVQANPVVAGVVARAFDGSYGPVGEFTTTVASAPRAQLGREAQKHLFQARDDALDDLPFLRVFLMPDHEVSGIEVSDPRHPVVQTSKNLLTEDGSVTKAAGPRFKADEVTLNTGVPRVAPEVRPGVDKHMYRGDMSTQALAAFLQRLGLLDPGGRRLKADARLLIGGTSLSSIEVRTALEPLLDTLVAREPLPQGESIRTEFDPFRFTLRPGAAAERRGALAFISRTAGHMTPPRHSHGILWNQDIDFPGTIEEQHALFLHGNGEQAFLAWGDHYDAAMAMCEHETPSTRRHRIETRSTAEVVRHQLDNSREHARGLVRASHASSDEDRQAELQRSMRTSYGARRQAAIGSVLQFGAVRGGAAIGAMESMAPHTYAGRAGFPMHRAMMNAITGPGTADNRGMMQRQAEWMDLVTGPPPDAHAATAMLFTAGIADAVTASYSDIQANPDPAQGRALFIEQDGRRLEFDAFILAPLFDIAADPLHEAMQHAIGSIGLDQQGQFEVTADRHLVARDGTATTVRDNSFRGMGAKDPATGSTRNAFAAASNNRETGVDTGIRTAYESVAQAHLAAAGFDDPVGEVEAILERLHPSDEDFDEQVAKFEPSYRRGMARAAFVRVADAASAGDAAMFARLMASAAAGDPDRMKLALLDAGHDAAIDEFDAALSRIEPFSPPGRAAYEARFPDRTIQVLKQLVDEAFDMAMAKLSLNPPGPAAPPPSGAGE